MIRAWLEQAGAAHSYRCMYKMALDLVEDTRAPRKIRRQASRLHTVLSPLIDQPIAPAAQLADARREFRCLHSLLEHACETCSTHRQNADAAPAVEASAATHHASRKMAHK